MDSNKANTGTFYLTIVLVVLTIILVVLAFATIALVYWVWRYPNPALAPGLGGPSVNGYWLWGLSIFLCICLLLTVSLQIVVAYLLRAKTRAKLEDSLLDCLVQIEVLENQNKKLTKDLSTANAAFADISETNEILAADLKSANLAIGEARRQEREAKKDAEDARKEALFATTQNQAIAMGRDTCEQRLASLSWVEKMIADQAKEISDHVPLTTVKPGSLKLTDSPRCVTLGIRIRNESLFDITIRAASVTGRLFFQGAALNDPARVLLDADRLPIENLKPMQSEMLVIMQPLWKSEAETISESDREARFWLGNLNIPISVENVSQQVETKPLRIGEEVEYLYLKDYNNDPLEELEAQHGKKLTLQELRQRIDALPPAERAKATKAALELYGESFYQ